MQRLIIDERSVEDEVLLVAIDPTTCDDDSVPLKRKRHGKRMGLGPRCMCYHFTLEERYNEEYNTPFGCLRDKGYNIYEEKKDEFVYLKCQFVVGNDFQVEIRLLHGRDVKHVKERVCLVFKQGKNMVQIDAKKFLEEAIGKIDRGFEHCPTDHSSEHEEDIGMQELKTKFFKDSIMKWMSIRQYENGYLSEMVFMSAVSWCAIKALVPLLRQCTDHYIGAVLNGRADEAKPPTVVKARKVYKRK